MVVVVGVIKNDISKTIIKIKILACYNQINLDDNNVKSDYHHQTVIATM